MGMGVNEINTRSEHVIRKSFWGGEQEEDDLNMFLQRAEERDREEVLFDVKFHCKGHLTMIYLIKMRAF